MFCFFYPKYQLLNRKKKQQKYIYIYIAPLDPSFDNKADPSRKPHQTLRIFVINIFFIVQIKCKLKENF